MNCFFLFVAAGASSSITIRLQRRTSLIEEEQHTEKGWEPHRYVRIGWHARTRHMPVNISGFSQYIYH